MKALRIPTLLLSALVITPLHADDQDLPSAKSPAESLAGMRVPAGLRVELLAAEPLVQDPVDIAWGPDGRLWVVEMADYPLGIDGKGKAGGRVKFLEDTDGDGKYDRATLFLDDIPFPNGVMPWRRGVLITAAPDVLYAEDTDGDGKVDVRRPLYTGFGAGNQQHRVNGLRWGFDNWIYLANGDSDGKIRSLRTGQELDLRGRDLRIRPDDGLMDLQTGRTQFGRNRDDWGNWFGCNNSNPMWHFVLADHYLRRNPHLVPPKANVPVSLTPGTAPVYPLSKTLSRFNAFNMVNRFTSACGVMIYRDRFLGDAFHGNSFVCEPVHNLVHREIMSPSGATFTSRRADDEQHREFLAASDNWFRPTVVHTGPDGALWVVDMYRLVIEHPQWIPADWQKRLDLRAGHDRGRIYRIVPEKSRPTLPRLDRFDAAELVATLGSSNGWQRDMAQQLLLWRNEPAALPSLQRTMREHREPLARLHALCTLDGLKALTAADVQHALGDEHPEVRRQAIRVSESFLAATPSLVEKLCSLAESVPAKDVQVRLQLAYSLGEVPNGTAGEALARIALGHADDPYVLAAVYSSLHAKNAGATLSTVLSSEALPANVVEEMVHFAAAFGAENAVEKAIATVTSGGTTSTLRQLTVLNGLLTALKNRPQAAKLLEREPVKALLTHARRIAVDVKAAEAERVAGLRLLAHSPDADAQGKVFAELLSPRHPPAVQQAALTALRERGASGTADLILAAWTALTPRLRGQALELLLSRAQWTQEFLNHIEKDQSLSTHVDAVARQRLLEHKDVSIRTRAAKLLAARDSDRSKVVKDFASALKLKGDVERGRTVFRERCAVCHKFEGMGQAVGPDLAALTNRSPEILLEQMLDPNRAVEDRYVSYLAATFDGQFFIGLLASESGASITMIGQDGKEMSLLRRDIEDLRSTGKSLMPEGLEKDITPQHFADLIEYVRTPPVVQPRKTDD